MELGVVSIHVRPYAMSIHQVDDILNIWYEAYWTKDLVTCGTLQSTGKRDVCLPWCVKSWVRLVKYDSNQFMAVEFAETRSDRRTWWSTVSKAALKSNRMTSNTGHCLLRGQGRCGLTERLFLWSGMACMQTDRQAANCKCQNGQWISW